MCLLVKTFHIECIPIFVKIARFVPVLFRKCTLVCLYTKNISKILTKWQPSQTFGYMQQTQRKKKNNLQIFSQSQQHLL